MPRGRISRSAGTKPASFRDPLSIPRSPPWCSATGTSISYDQLVAAHHRRQPRQIVPLHRLDTASAQRRAARLCDLRRHPFARCVPQAFRRSRCARPHRLDARGDEGPDLSGYLSIRAGACLGAHEDAGAQAEGARHPDGGRGLARTRGAGTQRPARPRAQGRCHRRHRSAGADNDRAAGKPAFAAAGLRALEMGRGHHRGRAARTGAGSQDAASARPSETRLSTARPRSSSSRCCCA